MVQRTKGNGPYAPLSATYYRDDAILEVGERAELLFVRGLAYSAEGAADGFISERQLEYVVGLGMKDATKRAAELIRVGLWERIPGGYVVRSWLKWNRTAEEIGRHKARDRERKAAQVDDGIRRESAGNPDGVHTDSVPQSTTQHSTTDSSNEESSPDPPRRRTKIPDIFPVTSELRAWAAEHGIRADLERETQQWLDYHRNKGDLGKDWLASWRTWMRNTLKWATAPPRASGLGVNFEQ